ncbi:MAG: hypothetical protein IJ254_07560 [Succinivibrio sp.]|jgi:hypothetical protein|nr:hypothetical protein [Succinivibrio sp.]
MNIFDNNYPQYRYAEDKASDNNDNLTPELKYVLHLEKMFAGNESFSCIYCTLLANFLISVEKDLIKKDKHIVEGLKELVIKYFTQLKAIPDYASLTADISENSDVVRSSTCLVLQLAEQGLMLQGVNIKFADVFDTNPGNMNITIKSSKIRVTEFGENFIQDYARILRLADDSVKHEKMASLLGDVIKILMSIYDNRNLKVR